MLILFEIALLPFQGNFKFRLMYRTSLFYDHLCKTKVSRDLGRMERVQTGDPFFLVLIYFLSLVSALIFSLVSVFVHGDYVFMLLMLMRQKV